MMRVALWKSAISEELLQALSRRGVEVVVLLGGHDEKIPSFTAYELFFSIGIDKIPTSQRPPAHLSGAFLDEYSRCVGRIGFNPITHANNFRSGGLVHPDTVMDWAQIHVQFARQIFQKFKPDQLWMANHPHMGFDNALVEVALMEGLDVLECGPVPIPAKFRFAKRAPGNGKSFSEVGPFDRRDMAGFTPNLFYLRGVRRDASETGAQAFRRTARTASRQRSIKSLFTATYEFSVRRRMSLLPSLLELLDGHQRSAVLTRFQRRRAAKSLQKKCQRISDWEKLDTPFAYFPLHLEPEALVSAASDGYYNQVNAIQALRAAIPEDWTILLKENPKQAHLHRDCAFFRRVADMRNVEFVDEASESGDLILASEVVATVTGTAGFEALRAGKPCVYFGDPWYESLPGAVRFDDCLDFRALAAMKPEQSELDDALALLSERLADGLVNDWMAEILPDGTSWRELMETTAESLVRIAHA